MNSSGKSYYSISTFWHFPKRHLMFEFLFFNYWIIIFLKKYLNLNNDDGKIFKVVIVIPFMLGKDEMRALWVMDNVHHKHKWRTWSHGSSTYTDNNNNIIRLKLKSAVSNENKCDALINVFNFPIHFHDWYKFCNWNI